MSKEIQKTEQNGSVKLSIGGVFDSAELLAPAIKALSERHNLIAPGGAIGGKLPLLHAAGLSFVFIDLQNETYQIPGKSALGIGKNALDRISAAAGVRWNPHLCGRIDDNSSPYVVEYQVAGTVLQLDGTERMITAIKRIDLRADKTTQAESWGSDAQEINRNAVSKNPPRDPWPQIIQQRQHILSLAESKTKNRAIRSLGVRTAYEPEELAKGFVILRLQFTGRSDDPEVEREVSMMIAHRALSSSADLYKPRMEHRELPLGRPIQKLVIQEEPEPENDPAAPETKAEDPSPVENKTAPISKCPADDPEIICGYKDEESGAWPKKSCSKFTAAELKGKIDAYEKKRPTWDPKWAAKNEAELKTLKAWFAYREIAAPEENAKQAGDVAY